MDNPLISYENTCTQYERNMQEFRKRKDMNLKDEYSIKDKRHGLLDVDEISQKENQTYLNKLASQLSLKKKNNPKYIAKMPNNYDQNIRVLDISNARLTTLQESIRNMSRLCVINLANNLFQEVPAVLLELPLSHINLNNNLLKSLTIGEIWADSLERLDVGKNHIRSIPDEIFFLKEIKVLDLRSNDFTKLSNKIQNLEKKLLGFGLDWIRYTTTIYHGEIKDMMIDNDLNIFWEILKIINTDIITCQSFLEANQQHYDDQIHDGVTAQLPKQSNIIRATQRNTELTLQEVNISQQCDRTYNQDAESIDDSQNLLHIAVDNEDLGVVRTLLNMRFDLTNQLNEAQHTPLSLAIKEEKYHCARIIINAQADLNIGGGDYNSILNQAVSKMQYYLIRDILNSKILINKQDTKGNGPLHNLIPSFKKNLQEATRIGHLLIEKGADPNLRNQNNNTPLHLAIKKSSYSAVRFILSINEQYQKEIFSFKLLGHKNNSVMHFAAKSENIKLILQIYQVNPYLLFTYNSEMKRPIDIIQKSYTLSKLISLLEYIYIHNNVLKLQKRCNSEPICQMNKQDFKDSSSQFQHKNSWDLNESDDEHGTIKIGISNFQILPNLKKQQSIPISRIHSKKADKISCEDIGVIIINKSIQQDRNDIKLIELQNQQNNSKFSKHKYVNKYIHQLLKNIEIYSSLLKVNQDINQKKALQLLLKQQTDELQYYQKDALTNLMVQNAIQLQKVKFEQEIFDQFEQTTYDKGLLKEFETLQDYQL